MAFQIPIIGPFIDKLRGVPPQVPEGVTSVPANPAVENQQTSQPEAASPTLNPTGDEVGPDSVVPPDLGTETAGSSTTAREIPVAEPEVSTEKEVPVATSMPTETEEPT